MVCGAAIVEASERTEAMEGAILAGRPDRVRDDGGGAACRKRCSRDSSAD